MIHVQHLLGIGHLQRSISLAGALADKGYQVIIVSGGKPVSHTLPERVELIQLPPMRSLDGRFDTLLDAQDRSVDDSWRKSRSNQLLELFYRHNPEILITETFPFGRRMLQFELLPLLEAAKLHPTCNLVISSIRDVLQPKSRPGRTEETLELVAQYYDRIIVHGDPRICRLEDSFSAADQIADKTSYSGYIARAHRAPAVQDSKEVLVSAGGSDRGLAILHCAIAARPLSCFANHPWRILVSNSIDEAHFTELSNLADDGVIVERNRADFPALLASARMSISQAGYNTMTDLLASSTPAVVIPYAEAEELEQTIRADRLQHQGRVVVLREQELSGETLAAKIEQATRLETELEISLEGAKRSAELIAKWQTVAG